MESFSLYWAELSCFKGTLKLFHFRITWYLSISSIVFCFYSHVRFSRFSSLHIYALDDECRQKNRHFKLKSVPRCCFRACILNCIQHIHIKLNIMSAYFKALWLFLSKYFLKNYSCTYQYIQFCIVIYDCMHNCVKFRVGVSKVF
jgi:hypothetical protein